MGKQKNNHNKEKKKLRNEREIRRIRRVLVMGVVMVASFVLPWITVKLNWLNISEEAAANIFGICATAIGAILVVIELNGNERVNCCSMLSDMNMKFIENERLMLLYQELTYCVQDSKRELHVDNADPQAVHSGDLMAYMTFYEVINEYIKNGVMSIQQMDDLFGDRFFKLIHNAYVQEHELYAEPSSYVNIFQLYENWKQYRESDSLRHSKRFVVLTENEIPDLYLDRKLYLQETVQFYMNEDNILFRKRSGEEKRLSLRRLLPRHCGQVLKLQEQVVEKIEDKSIFAESSEEEILESMLVDFCYGLFDGDKLVAVCICVLNRQTRETGDHERNLCCQTGEPKAYDKYITFDTIQVDPDYRGYGIQRYFLKKAEDVARLVKAEKIAATVAPTNQYSRNMFEEAGYEKFGGKEIAMYGSVRYLMVKEV